MLKDDELAGAFSLWFVYGSGAEATYWAFLMILAGFAVYAVMKIVDRRNLKELKIPL